MVCVSWVECVCCSVCSEARAGSSGFTVSLGMQTCGRSRAGVFLQQMQVIEMKWICSKSAFLPPSLQQREEEEARKSEEERERGEKPSPPEA